jgi:hypothetical protein
MGSFAMKLARTLRGAPLLVVKLSSRSPYMRADSEAAPLKCMVDVQSNSRCRSGRNLRWRQSALEA